ncbi:MAG: universal stress protein [Bacteroidales bacterium]|jgi:nucleotide-binding universal stress UspA family protein|nr:universal stress protein [Bacteroidales bacterium]
MKNIVMAIDFSKGSLHALKYAVSLAVKSGADLTLVWVDNQVVQQSVISLPSQDLRMEAKTRLTELTVKYASKLGKRIHFKQRKGKVFQEISTVARSINADLIIAGTYGGSGFEKLWIGSNAYRIITHASCPVITVRFEAGANPGLSRIIMPIDNSLETLQKLPLTAEIAANFNAEVHIVNIYQESDLKSVKMKADSYSRKAMQFLQQKEISLVYTSLETDNITETIIDYTLNVGGNLISVMTEQNLTGSSGLLGPNARLLVNQSPVPVLSVVPGLYITNTDIN